MAFSSFRFQKRSAFLLTLLIISCSWTQPLPRAPEPEGQDLLQETSRLEKMAAEDPAPSVRAQARLQLAALYVDCRNPRLNYTRAFEEMKAGISIFPGQNLSDEQQNWMAVLKAMDRLRREKMDAERKTRLLQSNIEKLQANAEKSQEANKFLREEMNGLKEVNQNLKEANSRMREAIERLKSLDLQMEERRKNLK